MRHYRPLRDVAEISTGFSIPGAIQHEPSGRYQLILPRHIDEGGRPFVYDDNLHALRMSLSPRAENYLVQPGDVLFVSRGEKNRAVVVHACPALTVAPTTFFVLRVRVETLLPEYLAWFLNQAPAQAAISQARTGSGTPIVQRAGFDSIPICVPPLDEQKRILAVRALMMREQQLLRQLSEAVARRNRAINFSLVEGQAQKELHRGNHG